MIAGFGPALKRLGGNPSVASCRLQVAYCVFARVRGNLHTAVTWTRGPLAVQLSEERWPTL